MVSGDLVSTVEYIRGNKSPIWGWRVYIPFVTYLICESPEPQVAALHHVD